MKNNWGIPSWLEQKVRERDKKCVYCGILMDEKTSKGGSLTLATWEHIINDASIITLENIALCCSGCNSSKGAKDLEEWLKSNYCKSRGITEECVAPVVRSALQRIRPEK